ncbi:carbon-phosphorus lyase complex subunit PhnJ, partial [Butyricicoccus sp. 1XD8-22]
QSRHRIPEVPLRNDQIMILQVPEPEPLRHVERSEFKTKQMHAEREYSGAYLLLFEQIMRYNQTSQGADYPVFVHNRYVMNPSPIPRFDNPKINQSEALMLFGAGREKKIYAVPAYTKVESLAFDDYPFENEKFEGKVCRATGLSNVFLDEFTDEETGETYYLCNDTSYMQEYLEQKRGI